MAPKIATYSFRHDALAAAVVMKKASTEKGEILIKDPAYDSEDANLWHPEMLIPYKMQGVTYAFMGPCPKKEFLPHRLEGFFPVSRFSKPLNSYDDSLDLGFLKSTARPFRSSPPTAKQTLAPYLKWLDRVQSAKGETWKQQGIFDLIQFSRTAIKYNHAMLFAAIHFWESSTNTFQIPCGMITPTLFDVAAITGLRPTGATYDPAKYKDQKSIFDTKSTSFSGFIEEHIGEGDVTDWEHIAFLTCWLTFFVFCSSSVSVAVKFITLAIKIHKQEDFCLSKLILASLYESLNIARIEIQMKVMPAEKLLIAGPIWLLQFWLNATFEPRMKLGIPETMPRAVEGTRLNLLTPEDKELSPADAFNFYFKMFSQQKQFMSTMAPFASRKYGLEWFRRSFPPGKSEEEAESFVIWRAFLKPTVLSARLTPGEKSYSLVAYQPNMVARQFGLTQLLPRSLFLTEDSVITSTTHWETGAAFKKKLSDYEVRSFKIDFFHFELSYNCTEGFHTWWRSYYAQKMVEECTLHQHVLDAMNAFNGARKRKPQGESKKFPDIAFFFPVVSCNFLCQIFYSQERERVAKNLSLRPVQIPTPLQQPTLKPQSPKER